MKLTNEDALKIIKGLSELEELDLPLNIKTSYCLARIRQTLTPIVNTIQEKQLEVYKKHGERTSRNEYKVPDEKIDDLQNDLNELSQIENEVQLNKLKLDDFGDNNIPFYIIEKLLLIIEE